MQTDLNYGYKFDDLYETVWQVKTNLRMIFDDPASRYIGDETVLLSSEWKMKK